MKLYLDVDGVMIPIKSWKQPEMNNDGFPEFSIDSVKALNTILLNNDIEIILTTSHNYKFTIEEWVNIFNNRDINIKSISRINENTEYLDRKTELVNWFKNNEEEDFLIIDDDKSLNTLPEDLKSKLIQTDSMIGLNLKIIKRKELSMP